MYTDHLPSLFQQLSRFTAGQSNRDELRRWFLPYHTALLPPSDDEDGDFEEVENWYPEDFHKTLFWQLVWLFEGEAAEQRHRDLARRITACYSGLLDPAAVLDLLPLIVARERFCSIVAKHKAGIVSRTGLVSVIGKTFTWEAEVREWLTAATIENLEDLCGLLEADDYSGAISRLNLPPA